MALTRVILMWKGVVVILRLFRDNKIERNFIIFYFLNFFSK